VGVAAQVDGRGRGPGGPCDGHGAGGQGGVAVVRGLTRDVPGDGPALGGEVLQPSGVAPGCVPERAGERGEGVDGANAVGAGGAPGRAVRCEAPARDEGVEGGVGREVPAPGRQAAGAPREVCPEAALVVGQPRAGRGSRLPQGLVRAAVRRAAHGTPGRRAGAGEAARRPGPGWCQGVREPRRGCRLRTRGAVAVATGRRDAVGPPTVGARRAARAVRAAWARWAGAAALAG